MLKSKKGNSLIEYAITFVSVGFVFGYALWSINPNIFNNIFSNTTNGTYDKTSGVLTIEPMTK